MGNEGSQNKAIYEIISMLRDGTFNPLYQVPNS